MKKILFFAALVLGMASCQTEPEGLDVMVGGEQEVMLNVSLPESTRSASSAGFDFTGFEGNTSYDLRFILEIAYNGNIYRDVETSKTTSATFPVRLVPGRDYTFTVWADLVEEGSQADLHYNILDNAQDNVSALSNITFKEWTTNVETRDAFCGRYTLASDKSVASIPTITLTRPFAKVRVVSTDIANVRKFGIEPNKATVTYRVPMYTAFNAVTGEVAGNATENLSYTYDIKDSTYSDNTNELTVFADYILVSANTIKFDLDVKQNDASIKNNSFNTEIPVEANKVTSIVGDVLTEGGNVSVTVDGTLGQKETYTYISDGAVLIKAMTKDGKYILGNDITVTEADLTRAQRNSATRAAANEPKNTVINLNGYTITVKNAGNEPLVTLTEGNTLTFAGEGNIVMDEDSTAPFVENDNNNATIIIEEATVTNKSTHQEATIVDGTAVVNEGVEIEGKVASGEITSQLDYVLTNGGEVTLLADVNTANTLVVTTTNPVVINGNGKTLTSTAARAINVSGATNVTIKNLTINASGERAINVIQNATNITIDNVTATAANYTVNIAGSAPNAVVAIKNSTLNGLCTVNVAAAGAYVTVDGSTVNCNDNNTTAGEAYAALSLNREAVGGKIIATNTTINVAEGSDSLVARNGAEDGVVTIDGSDEDVAVMYAVITYPDSSYYHSFATIAKAVEFATSGDVITLIRNVELTEALIIAEGKNVVLDLNGKTITGTDSATSSFGLITNRGNLLVKNGTMTLKAENNRGWNAYSSVISNNPGGNLVVEDATIEHLGGTDMAYGIDNLTNGKGTYAETTVNEGAVVKSCYRAIRQFLNGIEAQNILTVYAGAVVEGANKSIWMQDPSAKANTGKLVVNEGATLNGDVYLFVTAGSTEWPVEVSIAASTLAEGSEIMTGNVPAGYAVVEENGVWVVRSYVAVIGDKGYNTLNEAVAAVQDGETITLTANEVFSNENYYNNGGWKDGLGYAGDKSFTIDLNGKTVSQNGALNDYLLWFKNVGSKENTITIKNGTLDAGKTAFCALCTASSHDNKLTINLENVTLINEKSDGSTIKVRAGSTVNVNAGTKIIGKDSYLGIENWNATVNVYDGAEIYMNGTSSYNGCLIGVGGNGVVNVYGGYGKGVSGGLIAMTSGGTINVSGGEWIANTDGTYANSNKSVLVAQSDKQYNAGAGNAVVNVTGGTFKGGYNCYGNAAGDAQINISGGNFNNNPSTYVVEGHTATEANGVWTVQ